MSEELTLHRRAMLNIYFLIICQLLGQLTLLVNVINCGDSYKVSFGLITSTEIYPGGEEITFAMTIPNFKTRYCDDSTRPSQEICKIVPNLALAEYIYKLLLLGNFLIVLYNIINIYFTAYCERVPKIFSFIYMHNLYPMTYIVGSILYFTVSEALTLEEGFSFAEGFYIMVAIFVLAQIASAFNRIKIQNFVRRMREGVQEDETEKEVKVETEEDGEGTRRVGIREPLLR
ncbi:hypothetical protein SteCoe_3757 [Stentor coeruleus]|uniref:Uncharacterized protein n=1 Tax=Stentor coeruleus TaxID=5963 RepID=A0A1R2CWB4_9CILI|nr:hypothetical protein SteCoe_3757 [Stentor coeruleus]